MKLPFNCAQFAKAVSIGCCIVCCLFFPPLSAQNEGRSATFSSTFQDVCKKAACRPSKTITLAIDREHYSEITLPPAPYVHENMLNIAAAETVYAEIAASKANIPKLTYIKSMRKPERTLTATFTQDSDSKSNYFMLLELKNPLGMAIKYDAYIQKSDSSKFEYTSSCPILPGLSVFESWPYPIAQVLLKNFRFLKDKDDKSCR